MPIVENDQTKNIATPALIVAAIRSGGTFLSHCLSNHPAIFCDRGEPLHHRSVWITTLGIDRQKVIRALMNQSGYRVSMFRATYAQTFGADGWSWIVKRQPRVIWLRRENLIRQALSVAINEQARAGKIERPQHTFEETPPVSVQVAPAYFLRCMTGLEQRDIKARKRLEAMKEVLPVTYEEITANPKRLYMAEGLNPDAAARICSFLGVSSMPLPSELMRVNPGFVSDILSNWEEVRAAILGSPYAEQAEKETHWTF